MATTVTCPEGAAQAYPPPGDDQGSVFYWVCDEAFLLGAGEGTVAECEGENDGAGAYSGADDWWYTSCAAPGWQLVEDSGPPGIPAGFDPIVAGALFAKMYGVVFAFWALGKVPALVMRLIKRG